MTALVVLFLAAGSLPATSDVVARVDGVAITAVELDARLARLQVAGKRMTRDEALEALVGDHLLSKEARRRGLHQDAVVARKLASERRRIAGIHFTQEEMKSFTATDEQVREMFHSSSDAVRLQLTTFMTLQEAEAAMERLRKGGAFADEAKLSVDSRSQKAKGDLGWNTRMQISAEVAKAAFSAEIGKLTGPVPLRAGFAIIVVQERRIADEKELPARRPQLERFIATQTQEQVKAHLVTRLRERAQVKLDEAFVTGTGNRVEATPQEEAHVLAVVDGVELRYGDVLASLRSFGRSTAASHLTGPQVKLLLARDAIERILIEQEGLRRGHADAPDVAPVLAEAESAVLADALRAKLVADVKAPTDDEIRRYLAENPAQFTRPAHRTCAHVLLESKVEANKAAERLTRGEAFDVVAREMSADKSSAAQGGVIGEITDDRLDALAKTDADLAKAIRTAKPDRPTSPVTSRAGWHILKCGAPLKAEVAPLDQVRPRIVAAIGERRASDAVRNAIADLKSRARVEIARR